MMDSDLPEPIQFEKPTELDKLITYLSSRKHWWGVLSLWLLKVVAYLMLVAAYLISAGEGFRYLGWWVLIPYYLIWLTVISSGQWASKTRFGKTIESYLRKRQLHQDVLLGFACTFMLISMPPIMGFFLILYQILFIA